MSLVMATYAGILTGMLSRATNRKIDLSMEFIHSQCEKVGGSYLSMMLDLAAKQCLPVFSPVFLLQLTLSGVPNWLKTAPRAARFLIHAQQER